jgi:hypothetical protein
MRNKSLPIRNPVCCTVAVLLMGTAASAFATGAASLPAEHTQGAVHYLSGGIGADEAAAMKAASARYPLTLEFLHKNSSGHDEYLAADKVVISNMHGKRELNAVADGPFLLAKLPPGKYRVVATNDGKSERRDVNIKPHAPARVMFEW